MNPTEQDLAASGLVKQPDGSWRKGVLKLNAPKEEPCPNCGETGFHRRGYVCNPEKNHGLAGQPEKNRPGTGVPPSSTPKDYERNQIVHPLQDPIPQPAIRNEPLAAAERKEACPGRCKVSIVSYRTRYCDFDNLVGGCKYLLDALRRCGYIEDDAPTFIALEVRQFKVTTRSLEQTEIEITKLP